MSEQEDNAEETHTCEVVVQMTFVITSTTKKGKATAKVSTKKDVRTKTFSFDFEASESNYHSLMKTILDVCGEKKYDAVEKKPFSMRCSTRKS